MGPEHRLAVYGTLAPGEINHAQLAALDGRWIGGTVRGHLHPEGWGTTYGFPAIVLDDGGPEVAVRIFESPDLPAHWDRLDAFEGPGYRRRVTTAITVDGALDTQIYTVGAADPRHDDEGAQ